MKITDLHKIEDPKLKVTYLTEITKNTQVPPGSFILDADSDPIDTCFFTPDGIKLIELRFEKPIKKITADEYNDVPSYIKYVIDMEYLFDEPIPMIISDNQR